MKKILSIAMVMALTFMCRAASLNWTITAVYELGTETLATGYSAYLFISEQSSNWGAKTATIEEITALIESKGDISDYVAASAETTNGRVPSATGYNGSNFAAGDSLTGFAVIFDASDYASAAHYLVTSEKSASWTSGTGAKSLGFGGQLATKDAASWTSVPEPGTAALALLGIGMLIRRRRA